MCRLSIYESVSRLVGRWKGANSTHHDPSKTVTKSCILLNCLFHKPVRNDSTLNIDRGAHEDSKTMRAGGLAALEAEIHPF